MRQLKQLRIETRLDDRENNLDDTEETGGADENTLPTVCTDYWAGSVEKIEVMRKRLEAGEQLYHPFDCKKIIVSSRS